MKRGLKMPGARALLAAVGLSMMGGCGGHERVGAVGRADEVSVFLNTPSDGPVAAEVRRLFAYPVEVVGTDPAYFLDMVTFRRFGTYRRVKNQIFAAKLGSSDRLARAIPTLLSGRADDLLAAKKPFIRVYRNLWAEGQTSLFAVAWSAEELRGLLATCDSLEVRRAFEEGVIEGLARNMFALGDEKELSSGIAREHGFTLRLTPGFHAAEHPEGRLVKLNAADPVRLILIHWEERELPLDAATWDPILADLLRVYNDGDSVLGPMSRSYPTPFQGFPALKWEGIWQNEKYTIGGPFRAYAFHRDGKSMLLIGQVYAPGEDKVRIVRQVEAYLVTFRMVA